MLADKPKNILIAPLDWGLGHTSRCVPIIRHIQNLGHIPWVACNASQRSFIEETFGNINIIHLEGYNITYRNKYLTAGLLLQLPGIRKTIALERYWLQQQAEKMQIDGVISDNRYGLHLPGVPSVIITHQLQVQAGVGFIPDYIIQRIHYKYLNRFSATWIADMPGYPNLAGRLSHPSRLPHRATYIGLLSRFGECAPPLKTETDLKKNPLLILLSGPEPQRTFLSAILWRQALHYTGEIIFIEGAEDAVTPIGIPPHITYYKRVTGEILAPLLRDAGMVICRSGYSTLMDLVALGKKAIIIPTPGQTEQEYLGKSLHRQGIFYSIPQKDFNLASTLKDAVDFPFNTLKPTGTFAAYKSTLEKWIAAL